MVEQQTIPKPETPVSNKFRVAKYIALSVIVLVFINMVIVYLRYLLWIPSPIKFFVFEIIIIFLAVITTSIILYARKLNLKPKQGINTSGGMVEPISMKEADLIFTDLVKTKLCDYPMNIIGSTAVAFDIGKEGLKTPIYVTKQFLEIEKKWAYGIINMLNPYNRNRIILEDDLKNVMEEVKLLAEHPDSEHRKVTTIISPDGTERRTEEILPASYIQMEQQKKMEDI